MQPCSWLPGAHEVVDQLDLVVLALGGKALARALHRHVLALERLGGLHVRAHALFDLREVGLGDDGALGKLEVVVEAVLDRRPDRDLDSLIQLHHGRGEHVGGVMADQRERRRPAALGDDRDARAVGQRPRQIAHLGQVTGACATGACSVDAGLSAVQAGLSAIHTDLDRQRRARKPRPDRGRGVGAGCVVGQLQRSSVGKCDRDRQSSAESTHTGRARQRSSGGLPEGVVGERGAPHRAGARQLDERSLGGVTVGDRVVGGHDRGHLLRHQTRR